MYLGNRLWLWFVRVLLWLFALAAAAGAVLAGRPPTVTFIIGAAALAYVLWALCFSKSVKQHWHAARTS